LDVRFARVAVPVPGLDLLTYHLQPGMHPLPGARAIVPVGRRLVTGIVVDASDGKGNGHPRATRAIHELLDDRAFVPPDIVQLALWIADYYLAGPGEALATALPPLSRRSSQTRLAIAEEGDHPTTDAWQSAVLRVLDASGPLGRGLVISRAIRVLGPLQADNPTARESAMRAVQELLRAGRIKREHTLAASGDAFKAVRIVLPAEDPADIVDSRRLGAKQREALALVAAQPGGVEMGALKLRGIPSSTIARLAASGLVRVATKRLDRDPFSMDPGSHEAHSPLSLPPTVEQCDALDVLEARARAGTFSVSVLHGVTGSGKTYVYLKIADAVLRLGRRVLVLVPEIALTPAVATLFRAAFGGRVAIQHSGLADGERHDQWHRIRGGGIDIVVGTRSAVFAPLSNLGLVIVDEEHDTSYKQEESPRYHARDAAVVRAQNVGAMVVLGSATPAMETYQKARNGRYHLVTLSRRVLDRPLADVHVVNMRDQYAARGPDAVLSEPLERALDARLHAGEQAIILLNRRGFSPALFCRQCGQSLDCPNCSVSLTVHKRAGRIRCHYCDYGAPLPPGCDACGGAYLEYAGVGTERVEAEIQRVFPEARVARVDRDTMTRRGAIADVLQRFGRRELDVLVGTQMIAKGHDFPQVTLVGVISADVGLGLADFRAAERTFQLLTQVAGRAGRGTQAGEAIIQTLVPEHYSIRLASRQDYVGFFQHEVAFREKLRYPPAVSLVNVVVRARSLGDGLRETNDLIVALGRDRRGFRVLGPAPAPLERLRGEYRVQVFLKGLDRRAMRDAVRRALSAHPHLARRASVDVDPQSML
jgi:primosomal protein N' (replication factor Y)